MSGLWVWLTEKGQANCKPVRDEEADCESTAPRENEPRNTQEAVDRATEKWDEQGDRADQDYYHVPGGGNQADSVEGRERSFGEGQGPEAEIGAAAGAGLRRSSSEANGEAGTHDLIGLGGRDTLVGALSNDRFIFQNLSDSGIKASTRDVILDFMQGEDHMVLTDLEGLSWPRVQFHRYPAIPSHGC